MRPLLRAIVRTATAVSLLVLAVLVGAFTVESVRAWHDSHAMPRVGQSIDIGGRRLNLFCLGTGTPTVIFESGRSSPGYIWTPTQRAVAQVTRACWYDRAGLGWSDRGPDPNWGDTAARDLHAVLHHGGVRAPYVLVGHSFGGYIIRLFHEAYPGETEGMVFVDAAQEDAGRVTGIPHRNRAPLPRSVINALATVLPYFGFLRVVERPVGATPRGWTDEEWRTLALLRRHHAAGAADAHEGPEDATAALVRHARRFEGLPIVVMTHGESDEQPSSRHRNPHRSSASCQ